MNEIISSFFFTLEKIDDFFWSYIGFIVICTSGIYLTIKSKGKQFRILVNISKTLKDLLSDSHDKTKEGLHPIKLLFTSVGGMIGIGNIAGVSLAVMYGGPGAIFWMWVASLSGMLIKYSEIYLGVKHRVRDGKGSYNGGPMYYLQDVFKNKGWAYFAAVLLCVYGVEVYQYKVLVNRFENTFDLNKEVVIFSLLAVTLLGVSGGIKLLSEICTIIMPFFMIIYVVTCLYIIGCHFEKLPSIFVNIFYSAFTGQSAIGGFAGSSMLFAAYWGSSKAVYSGDIGIGYDSVVQSETRAVSPVKQARLSIIALFMDTLICTMTTLTVVVTGAWYKLNDIEASQVISTVFSDYFVFSDIFLTSVMFFAGFTTVIAFFVVGLKAANFICNKYGKIIYFIYGIFAFIFFSYFSEEKVVLIMSVTAGLLMCINVLAIILMRNEIKFEDETSKGN